MYSYNGCHISICPPPRTTKKWPRLYFCISFLALTLLLHSGTKSNSLCLSSSAPSCGYDVITDNVPNLRTLYKIDDRHICNYICPKYDVYPLMLHA